LPALPTERLSVEAISFTPLLGPPHVSGPLKANPVTVGISERELPHTVGCHARRRQINSVISQVFISHI
jgi:hypothetical protein